MYVQPVPLIPNTPPWATASGSTATAAIGQIVAMKVVTSMSRRKYLVDDDVADQQQHREHAEDVALQRGVAAGRRAEQHEGHAAEREQREHQRARVDVLAEQPGADAARSGTARSDPISAAFATLLCVAPAKNTARFSPKKTPGTQRLAHVAQRDPPARAPQDDVPDEADRDHPPERDQHAGRLGALDQRRAERERDHEPEDREHPERLRAQPPGPRGHPRRGRDEAHTRTLTGTRSIDRGDSLVAPECRALVHLAANSNRSGGHMSTNFPDLISRGTATGDSGSTSN